MSAVMQQNTADWLAWRKTGIGASDVPVILGVSPWRTPYQLWQEKTGRSEGQMENSAMARGKALEAQARLAYESTTGEAMQPAERTHAMLTFMRASLDGISLDGKTICEIKCPGKDDHAKAVAGEVPEKYGQQIQAQLFVSGAERCDYYSYDGSSGVIVSVLPDVEKQTQIVEACKAFWQHVTSDTPPPLCERDERDDAEWMLAASAYSAAKAQADRADAEVMFARERLIKLAPEGGKGGGVSLIRAERAGSVAYAKAIKELAPDADLSKFTSPPTVVYSVRTA